MLQELPFTIPSLQEAYASGVTAADVIAEVYRRLAASEHHNVFICVYPIEDVLERVNELGSYDPRKPLWGIPFAVKDNIDALGLQTTAGCPDFAYLPERDARVVENLRQSGALLIGKTNLDQFATGLVGTRSPWGACLNAFDPDFVSGGSSSGSAVAVALNTVSFSLGTDTAGSGRVPAACLTTSLASSHRSGGSAREVSYRRVKLSIASPSLRSRQRMRYPFLI